MVEYDDATYEVWDRVEMKVESMKLEMEDFLTNLTSTITPKMEEEITEFFEDDPKWVNTGGIWKNLMYDKNEMEVV
jgi:hypothetical protein